MTGQPIQTPILTGGRNMNAKKQMRAGLYEPEGPAREAGASSGTGNGPARTTLMRAVDRLCELLDRETAALQARQPADLQEFNDRKNQALLELSRLASGFSTSTLEEHFADRLAILREKLELNRSVLKMHIDAVHEVSEIVAGAIREADSDGTYSAAGRAAGNAP